MKKMNGETEICGLDKLPDGKPYPVFPLGLPVLLVRDGGSIFAVENRCAHMGCPLSGGFLDGHILTCPCHDWRYDVRSGAFLDAPEISLKTYRAAIRDNKVFLEL